MNQVIIILFILLLSITDPLLLILLYAQDIGGEWYTQLNWSQILPTAVLRGSGLLKMLYRDYFPGKRLNMGSVYISYDTYHEPMQGGIGFILISENKLGWIY